MTLRAERPLLHVCYAQSDEVWVMGEMLPQLGLTRDQVRTQLDYELGQPKARELERGIVECRITVVLISPASCRDHPLAHVADVGIYAGLESGRPRVVVLTRGVPWDSLSLTERSQVGLDCSSKESTAAAMAKLREFLELPEPVVARPDCPYPGLDAFQASNRLFGRDQDSDAILGRIHTPHSRILLLGHSGSGKSSLICSAVLPALSRQEYLIEVVPEQADLVAALRTSVAGFRIDHLVAALDDYGAAVAMSSREKDERDKKAKRDKKARKDRTGKKVEEAIRQLEALAPPDGRRRVLVIDPLEAIFTNDDKVVQAAFFYMLSALWSRSWCTVILCLRSDFHGRLLLAPCAGELVGSEYQLARLGEAGLRAAIVQPARSVGVEVEPALVERLIQEVAQDRSSSALPMLQVALQHLWRRLEHQLLKLESYESMVRAGPELDSGLRGDGHGHSAKRHARGLAVPLSLQADRVLEMLSVEQRAIADRILLDLVHLGEGRSDTRRHRTLDQLRRQGDLPADFNCVVRALVNGRLVTADGGGPGGAGAGYLHLAHDALIQGWPRLATLVERNRKKLIQDRGIEAFKHYRARRRGRRVPRWLAMSVMPAFAVAMAMALWQPWSGPQAMSECERAASGDDPRRALAICGDTVDPDAPVWASEAHLALGELEDARRLGEQLLRGPRAADGHRILGSVSLEANPANLGEARAEAAAAIAGYLRAGDRRGLRRGELTLSQVAWNQGEFTAALAAADDALALVGPAGDVRDHVTAQLLRAKALSGLGDLVRAHEALRIASGAASTACDRTWAYLETSVREMDRGRDAVAQSTLEVAGDASRHCHRPAARAWIELMTAWLQRRQTPDGARAALARAGSLETAQAGLLLNAELAAQRRALAEADRYLAQADAAAMDPEWAWKVAYARAELAELRGGTDAERFYRRAIDRSIERPGCPFTQAPRVPVRRRRPLDGLLALYARTCGWSRLLAAILEFEAGEVSRPAPRASACQPTVTWESRAGLADTPAGAAAVERTLAAWRARDLVIVIAAPPREIRLGDGRDARSPIAERIYRLQIVDGQLAGEDVGDANEAARAADALSEHPDDVPAARLLGRMIVPPGSIGKVLDVLTLGALVRIPLAALRDDDGELIIARRPLARVLSLRPGAATGAAQDAPVIVANSRGDLPWAVHEGVVALHSAGNQARWFGAGAPDPATIEPLRKAGRASILHISGHASENGRWPALDLANASWITSQQIAEERLAPGLAVLVVSRAAVDRNDDPFGSIASAFLEAGTGTVIATDHTIADGDSYALVRAFYSRPDWRSDPVRALARAQQAVSRAALSDPRSTWARFAAFRRPPDAPERAAE